MKSSNVRLLGRVAAVALLAGTAAGCSSDVTRFGSNLFEPTDNQSQIVTGSVNPAPAMQQPAPVPAYSTPAVSSQPLPPTPGAVVSNQPFVRHDGQAVAAMPAPVQPVADPAVQPATQPLSGSPGWSAAGGTPVTVRPGETVQTIARRYGVPESAILAANGLPKGGTVQPGSQVVIPVYSYGQSQTAAGKPPATRPAGQLAQMPASGGNVYVVKPGDSLGKIANSYGMKSTQLAAANGIDATQPIKIGQKLRIPAAQPAGQQVASLNPGTMNDATPVAPKPAALPPKAPVQTPVSQANGQVPGQPAPSAPAQNTQTASLQPTPVKPQVQAPSVAETSAPAAGNFRWPVRGRVISAYGVKANGERNDGINIEVPEGTPIKAAEGGEVIYAGNELKGYGNLVLVKHPNGYVSAYAHASEILVQRGDTIMRGQTLGKVGATGNVARPQLHFEIRNGNRPVDPLPHLSG